MVINTLDYIGQKVAEGKQAEFVTEAVDVVIQTKRPQLLELDERSTTGSAIFPDTSYRYLLQWYMRKMNSTTNLLEVIWQREEEVSVVSRELSEEELLDSWDRYLEEHWDELVAQYKGKYVAIWKNSVYDSDEDLVALAERVYSALGYRPIFMPYIGDKEQIYEFIPPL